MHARPAVGDVTGATNLIQSTKYKQQIHKYPSSVCLEFNVCKYSVTAGRNDAGKA